MNAPRPVPACTHVWLLFLFAAATLLVGGSLRAENCYGGGAKVVLRITRHRATASNPAKPESGSEALSV